MLPNHVHGPNCGCKDYLSLEDGEDLFGCIEVDKKIDYEKIVCLNEADPSSGKKVLKAKDEKLKTDTSVKSDMDGELLFIIPFNQQVKLKSINIRAISDDLSPVKAKLYKNVEGPDFTIAESEPVQELLLGPNLNADVECALKIMKFQNVFQLVLHLSAPDKDQIGVTYIGIRGIQTSVKRTQPVLTTYESKPNVSDHKVDDQLKGFQDLH